MNENMEVINEETIKKMNLKKLMDLSIDFIDIISNEIDEDNNEVHELLGLHFDIIYQANKILGYK